MNQFKEADTIEAIVGISMILIGLYVIFYVIIPNML